MAGRIRAEDLETLRERADLIEVITAHTQLKKAGRIFKGLCPFHQEKTPSFTVDPDKGLFHCFGCGAGGDVFTFVRQSEGLSFNEAAERLAGRFGVTLRHEGADRGEAGGRRALIEVVRTAAEYFSGLLMNVKSSEAAMARKYLEGRNFSSDDARVWGLGYAPTGSDSLYRHLLARKFTPKQIVDAGLAVVSEKGEHRDRFRGRLMFPISDIGGQVIGFGARSLGGEAPKYLNSPETPVYRKAKILFGLDRSRQEISNSGAAVITEGYTDVIALHKIGISSAVATCGTALGEDHLVLIKRFADRVILAFDSDAAGAVASERAFGLHASVGLEVLVAPIPAGKDPADVALTEGLESVRLMLDQALPLMRFVLEAEISRHRLDTPEGKGRAVRAAAQLLSWEPSRVARGEHAFWVARRIGTGEVEVQREIAEVTGRHQKGAAAAVELRRPGHVKLEREALALLIEDPERLAQVREWINEDHFTVPEHRVLLHALISSKVDPVGGNLMDRVPDEATRRLTAELALTSITTDDSNQILGRLEEFRLRRQIDSLRATLDRLDPGADGERYDALFRELLDLEERRREIESE